MSQIDCNSCSDLQTNAAEFVTSGITTNVCSSLKNNTGLGKKKTNEADMNDANDCLVGRMAQDVNAYEVCDWKEFIKKFIGNIYEVIKGLICWLAGLQNKVDKHDCQIDILANGASFHMDIDDGEVVLGKGVEYVGGDSAEDEFSITYIAGGLARGQCQVAFHTESWTDERGTHEGNSVWGTTGDTITGNELIYEVRIDRSKYPQIKSLYAGFGQESNAGGYHVRWTHYGGGEYAPGQHGGCNRKTGDPSSSGADRGHLVPNGWTYCQLRMSYIMELVKSGDTSRTTSPVYFFGMRMNLEDMC